MRKQLTARGKQVDVEDFDLPQMAGEAPARRVVATVDGIRVEKTLTAGAVDGPRLVLTLAQVQQDLDALRQELAEEVAWQAERAGLLKQVQ